MKLIGVTAFIACLLFALSTSIDILLGYSIQAALVNELDIIQDMRTPEWILLLILLSLPVIFAIKNLLHKRNER
jgi:hypothetical protein